MAAELTFPVMGAQAQVVVVGGDPVLAMLARNRLFDLESKWSRFLPHSEVTLLNEHAGDPVAVSSETLDLVERATIGWLATDGRFDPTVLGAVIRAGYDRTFDEVVDPSPGDRPVVGAELADRIGGCAGIVVDRRAGTVCLPHRVGFDPGGIGKGLAADLACQSIVEAGADGAMVNVGGDLVVRGTAVPGRADAAWGILVDDPFSDTPAALLSIGRGAVATSSRLRRRWTSSAGTAVHHLIDPSTGAPAEGDVATATVVSSEGWRAEVLAKAAFLGGIDEGVALADRLGAAALLIDHRGRHHASGRWGAFTRPTDDVPPVPATRRTTAATTDASVEEVHA